MFSEATGTGSVAIGQTSVASQDNTLSVGNLFNRRRIVNVADGVGLSDAATVLQVQFARDAATGFYQLERDARIAADSAITTSATNEASTRAAADTTLQNNINSEATTRAAAISTVQSNLNAEANARIASDAQLTASLATETSQRMAADSSMATRLSALEGSLGNLDARFERLDRRIAAGTAVATAMSGNAFLPDMKFNLTANVATYDGAHAGAIQMGALVSRHVAVNAGVAFGFNRGGKTAARAGMTFGW